MPNMDILESIQYRLEQRKIEVDNCDHEYVEIIDIDGNKTNIFYCKHCKWLK